MRSTRGARRRIRRWRHEGRRRRTPMPSATARRTRVPPNPRRTRRRGQEALEATRIARTARESELASARIEHDWRSRSVRAREQEVAARHARLTSLEELEAARAGYGDAARAVLAQANGAVEQLGAIADYLDVDAGYERAVEACLGDLLQHVIVERSDQAVAGFELVREQSAGRCGFLITSNVTSVTESRAPSAGVSDSSRTEMSDLVPLSSVVQVTGPHAEAIRGAIGDAWIADSYDRAAGARRKRSARRSIGGSRRPARRSRGSRPTSAAPTSG